MDGIVCYIWCINHEHRAPMNTHTRTALEELGIAVRTADLRRVSYEARWIYINRIGKRTRILKEGDAIGNGGTIRAAIKVTWNEDTYSRSQMERHVRGLLRAMDHFATVGSVHPFRRVGEVGTLVAGGLDTRRAGVWYMVNPRELGSVRRVKLAILGI